MRLWCGHVLCVPCAVHAHGFGHRHCPVCRVPHLLDVAKLRRNALSYREQYNDWRRGKPKGCKRETGDVSGFPGWRLDGRPKGLGYPQAEVPRKESEAFSVRAGLLWTMDRTRVLEAKLAARQAELHQLQLENKLSSLKQELAELRAQYPLRHRVRWADEEEEGCLAEPPPSPRGRSKIRSLKSRPISRHHIHGTDQPPPKLSAAQVDYRKRLIGRQVRVVEGPDANLHGRLIAVSDSGYATIMLPGPGPNVLMPPRVDADPAARFGTIPRCIHSYRLEPFPGASPLVRPRPSRCHGTTSNFARTEGF